MADIKGKLMIEFSMGKDGSRQCFLSGQMVLPSGQVIDPIKDTPFVLGWLEYAKLVLSLKEQEQLRLNSDPGSVIEIAPPNFNPALAAPRMIH